VLDYEKSHNPFAERLASILLWRSLAEVRIRETKSILERGRSLMELGIKPFDALHVPKLDIGNQRETVAFL